MPLRRQSTSSRTTRCGPDMAESLGIIETRGFVPAVVAADAAVKTAEVSLIGCRFAGAGLVSVFLTGDVSSVHSAVQSGVTAARPVGEVVSDTVIARTAEGLEMLFPQTSGPGEPSPAPEVKTSPAETVAKGLSAAAVDPGEPVSPASDPAELGRLSVARLRGLARKTPGIALTKARIKFANKQELIDAIAAAKQERRS